MAPVPMRPVSADCRRNRLRLIRSFSFIPGLLSCRAAARRSHSLRPRLPGPRRNPPAPLLVQAAEIVGTDLALVRVYVDWSEVEPLPGLYCTDALEQRLALARAKGVRVVVALGSGAPPWLPHESMRGQYGLERHGTLQKWGFHAANRLASVWAPVYGHGAATAFEAGLARTVDWYLANRPWWERIRSGAYRQERLGLRAAS